MIINYRCFFKTVDTIEEQIELSREKNEEYTIVMPQFKITSDIQAEDYLRKVGVYHYF